MSKKTLFLVAFLVVVSLGVYQAISALGVYGRTGVLNVTATDAGAKISISQENHQAVFIGTGTAHIRVAPGVYLLNASDSGSHTSTVATVYKKRSSHATLNLAKPVHVRTVQDINFEGTDALINAGLSSTQVSELEQYFFQYKPSANTVSIDSSSVEPGPHNPNTDIGFKLDFNVTVDSTSYAAVTSYADVNNISLVLINPQTGATVFNSAPAPQSGD